uniref:Basonuclin zinc finger protein 2 n=1 Tax=Hucho hucho TaxID=62062 RepID=A0A4W5NK66_9TELE
MSCQHLLHYISRSLPPSLHRQCKCKHMRFPLDTATLIKYACFISIESDGRYDAAGKVLDRWSIMSREEEIITLQQFLRFGETKSIVELMAIQEKEGQAVTVPSSKTDSGIRTFIESNSTGRGRSPGLLNHMETSSPSSIHHFENIPNSLAFLLPFQYINPVSAPIGQSPSRVGALGGMNNVIEPKQEPNNRASPISPTPSSQPSQQSNSLNDHQAHHHFVKSEQSKSITHSSFSSKMHRMRRMGATSRKGRVCCNSCGKTFYDKGTLKIHYNAVHLKIKHRCTIEGCNMVFSSLRSRNRHSANPNPRLHMPMLRNNRDKDLIRGSGPGTPVISSAKSGFTLTSPGRPPLGFATPPLDPLLQSPLQSPLVFPSLKSVQPIQPVPPFYRTLLSPQHLVSPPVSLPTSPILLPTPSIPQQEPTAATNTDPTPKKKPRKSSMPVKIEKEVIDVADEYDEDKDDDDDDSCHHHHHHHHHPSSHLHHNNINGNRNNNNSSGGNNNGHHSGGSGHQSPSQDEMSPGLMRGHLMRHDQDDCREEGPGGEGGRGERGGPGGELRCMDSFTSEDQDHERDFENDSETPNSNDPKICYVCKKSFKSSYSVKLHYKNVHLKEMHVCTVSGCNAAFPSRRSRDRHSSNINLHRKLLTKELDDIVLDPQLTPLPKDLRAEFLAKIYAGHHLGLDTMAGAGIGGASLGGGGLNRDASSPAGTDYPHHHPLNHHHHHHHHHHPLHHPHTNGFYHRGGPQDDYMVLDLSTASSVQSSGSVHSSRQSDEGSDEGAGGQRDQVGEGGVGGRSEEGLTGTDPSSSPTVLSSTGGSGGILCSICHKVYSNKGTLRVHYKTVHLREMHKCKVAGCNMMFSSVRSRNRHSQNPNLHKNNVPFTTMVD